MLGVDSRPEILDEASNEPHPLPDADPDFDLEKEKKQREADGPLPDTDAVSKGIGKLNYRAREVPRRTEPPRADVALVTAMQSPELEQGLQAFSDTWHKEGREGVVYNVATLELQESPVTIAAAAQNDIGMVPAAILATKTIQAWRPRLLAMAGVCAGVRGKVELGDVVVGRQVFDYGAGKREAGNLAPDFQPASLNETILSHALALASDRQRLAEIRDLWPIDSGKPRTDLVAHVGPMASGAAVLADETVVKDVTDHQRSLIAIDMEAYGVMRAAAAAIRPPATIVVKGVQDFADSAKSDEHREYAAFVSARFLYRLLAESWSQFAL